MEVARDAVAAAIDLHNGTTTIVVWPKRCNKGFFTLVASQGAMPARKKWFLCFMHSHARFDQQVDRSASADYMYTYIIRTNGKSKNSSRTESLVIYSVYIIIIAKTYNKVLIFPW